MVVSPSRRLPWTGWLGLFQRKSEPKAEPVKESQESIVEQVEKMFSHVFALTFKQD
ncbi:MAG: hypothetical protein KF857_08870 [Fimbriimonadaceae bacterium]|nr:hypothetical protein [Fimbriimonadaceae bacterium]